MATVPSWDEFITEHLLYNSLFCGACLLSQHGEKVYTHGHLSNLSQEETQQFISAFRTSSQAADQEVMQTGFCLTSTGNRGTRQFKIYSKTFTSMYSTSSDGQMGLTVNKLPYGVLICLFTNSVTAAKAVKQVEQFCDRLRS